MYIFDCKIHRPTSTSNILIPTLSAYYIARPTINIVCAITALERPYLLRDTLFRSLQSIMTDTDIPYIVL